MFLNPDCSANRSRKTSLPLPKPRPYCGDGRGQPPYTHILAPVGKIKNRDGKRNEVTEAFTQH